MDRVGLEPEAVDEIIERCARLPLALAVVAARAATHPTFPLAALAAELRTALDALAGADPGTDPRVVFSWSYDALGASAARLLRLLGLHPGPDVTAPAAASLAGLPPERVRAPLAELTHANLLAEHSPGRYRFHDLLRAYAHDLAYAHDSEADRRAALDRLLHHYVQTAHAAAPLLNRHRERESPPPAPDGVTPEPVADAAQATAWFTAEHAVLLASVAAAAGGFDDHVGHLASALVDFLDRQGHWTDWAATQSAALDAARRQGDRSAEAAAHRGVARAYARLGRTADAHEHLLRALDLYRDLDDVRGQAGVQHSLASVTHRLGRGRDALEHATRALGLYRRAGHRTGEAWARNAVGWYHALLGDHEAAVEYCRQALDLHRELGDRTGEADSSDSLGYALHHLGRHDEATARYRYALDLFRQLDDRYFVADTLSHLADTYLAAGDRDAARDALTQSLDILDQLGHADADRVRGSLKDLDD